MATFCSNHGYLRVQFRWQGRRYRFGLGMRDTRDNRRIKKQWLLELSVALKKDSFKLEDWFTGGRSASLQVAPPILLGTYARQWLEHQSLSPLTRRDHEYLFRLFIDRTSLAQTPVAQLNKHEILLAIKGKSPDRSRRFLNLIRRIAEDAIDDGLLAKNPAKRVPNPAIDEPLKEIEAFTASEQAALINGARTFEQRELDRWRLALSRADAMRRPLIERALREVESLRGRDRLFIQLSLATGLRPIELLRLQAKDFDAKRKRLTILVTKKRGRPMRRTVDLEPAAVETLRELTAVPRISGILFAGEKRPTMNYTSWVRRRWANILKTAKVAYRNPYAMKHTCVINWLEAGRNPNWIADKLGHESAQMIWQHYGRLVNRTDEKVSGL